MGYQIRKELTNTSTYSFRKDDCLVKVYNNNSRGPMLIIILISPKVSGTEHGGTEPYKAILGVGFPLHKPYIQLT